MEEIEKLKAGHYKIIETELLTDPKRGVATITTYWSDGTTTKREVPKYPMIFPIIIDWFGL